MSFYFVTIFYGVMQDLFSTFETSLCHFLLTFIKKHKEAMSLLCLIWQPSFNSFVLFYESYFESLYFNLQVERERNLLNSKLLECENLLQQPYIIPSNTIATNSFHVSDSSFSATSNQKAGPPSVSSFSQLGAFVNLTSNRQDSALKQFTCR